MNKRILAAFFLFQLCFGSYIFNYTTRERSPIFNYHTSADIICFDISTRGSSLAVGTEDDEILYFNKGNHEPKWRFKLESSIESVQMTPDGGYILVLSSEGDVYLFRSIGVGNNTPIWMHNIGSNMISDIYSSGGFPTEIYMLISSREHIQLFSNKDGLVREYDIDNRVVSTKLSFNGKYIGALDSKGYLYLFETNNPDPVWVYETTITNGTLSMPLADIIVVGGASTSGGKVLSLSKERTKLWDYETSYPIVQALVTDDGETAIIRESDNSAAIIKEENGFTVGRKLEPEAVKWVNISPFGPYVTAMGVNGNIYLIHDSREKPLWVYKPINVVKDVEITSIGDTVFVSYEDNIAIIDNTINTGVIPGSRSLWGVWFILALSGLMIHLFQNDFLEKRFNAIIPIYPLLGATFIVGSILGFILWRSILTTCSSGLSLSIYIFMNRRSSSENRILGFIYSALTSVFVSVFYSLFLWFRGVEENIILLVIRFLVNGLRTGIVIGFIGIIFMPFVRKLNDSKINFKNL